MSHHKGVEVSPVLKDSSHMGLAEHRRVMVEACHSQYLESLGGIHRRRRLESPGDCYKMVMEDWVAPEEDRLKERPDGLRGNGIFVPLARSCGEEDRVAPAL